jgi:hypothetical protein
MKSEDDKKNERTGYKMLAPFVLVVLIFLVGFFECVDASSLTPNGAIQEATKYIVALKASLWLATSFILFFLLRLHWSLQRQHAEQIEEFRKLSSSIDRFLKRLQ